MKKKLLTTLLATMTFLPVKNTTVVEPMHYQIPTELNDYFVKKDDASYLATPEDFFYNKNTMKISDYKVGKVPEKAEYLKQERFWEITDSLYNNINMPKEITKDIFWAFVKKESSFNINAYNEISGASGLTQMMPAAWKEIDNKTNYIIDRFTTEKSLENGLKYLKWIPKALKKMNPHFDSLTENEKLEQIVASYNWGIGKLETNNWEFAMAPKETKDYYNFVINEIAKK